MVDLHCCVNFCCTAVTQLCIYMHSFSCRFNNQGDNIQPCHTPLPVWAQAVVPCLVQTVASWPAYKFLRRQVRWSSIPIILSFPVCCDLHKGFSVVNEAEVDVFLSKNHKAHKSWKWTSWSFTGSAVLSVACRPAALARPLKLLEHKILSLPRPTDSEFLDI